MQRWVAERGVDSDEIWRDEDIAMAWEHHVFTDRDKARTMLVGMLATEALACDGSRYPEDKDRRTVLLALAELVASGRMNRVELPWNKVYYQIREF